jgi:hypothetical protein
MTEGPQRRKQAGTSRVQNFMGGVGRLLGRRKLETRKGDFDQRPPIHEGHVARRLEGAES